MTPEAAAILDNLRLVADERQARLRDPTFDAALLVLKHYQQRRFRNTYADLLVDPRYAPAAQFFLGELYGPQDFSARDTQFARIVPGMTRLAPLSLVRTIASLAELHSLSESLDSEMARVLGGHSLDAGRYVSAWQAVGRHEARVHQIDLLLEVGHALEGYTRNPVLRRSLRMMRAPARLAGLDALQGFLEKGFDTFGAMQQASEFLSIIEAREHRLCERLFSASPAAAPFLGDAELSQLPTGAA